jgi:NAD(P) transhydrogenase
MSLSGASVTAFEQFGLLAGLGSSIGAVLASGVGPTELPQTVAAFHSLVGLAAMAGAAGEYFGNSGELGVGTLSAIYLATLIGGITATGSMVAFGKLAGLLKVSSFVSVFNDDNLLSFILSAFILVESVVSTW